MILCFRLERQDREKMEIVNIQLGGGIRSVEDIKFWIDAGVSRVAKTLQGFLATSIDGVIGSGTLQAIQDYPTTIKGVIEVFTAQRSQFYRTLKNYDTFGKGWDRRCYETRKTAVEMYVTSHLKNS